MRIGTYEIEGELGRGGMGVVYRARSSEGRAVALKLLSRATSPTARDRFERERRLLASFGEEDGFVPLLDAGVEKGQPFLVMPLLEGGTLGARLRRGALSIAETVALGEAIASALARAHARGVVHRDMKPDNVLFSFAGAETGDWGRPLLADLGLAKHFDSDSPGASRSVALSKTGQILGTVGYMAPEQARDARAAGPAADVFATGAILYECLSGSPAFEGNTILEVIGKVENESPSPLANVRPETPAWLASVVDRALARDVRGRYPDGAALLAALGARASGHARRGRGSLTPGKRIRALLAVPALLALAVLLLAVVTGPRSARPSREYPGPASANEHARPGETEDPLAAVRARLEGTRPVTSADAPASLLEPASAVAAAARKLAARRAIAYSLDDATRMRAAFPEDRAAAVLWGIAALGEEPDVRARALATLEAAAREIELARPLAALARYVDRFAGPAARIDPVEIHYTGPVLAEYLRPLADAPPETVDLAVAPLTLVLVARALGLEEGARVPPRLIAEIGLVDAAAQRTVFPPRLVRACIASGNAVELTSLSRRMRVLEEIAGECKDPLWRGAALGRAVVLALEFWMAGDPIDEGEVERDGLAVDQLRAQLDASGVASDALPTRLVGAQRDMAWFHLVRGRGNRDEELARGLRLATDSLQLEGHTGENVREVVRFLLEAGKEGDPMLSSLIADPGEGTPLFADAVFALERRRRLEGARAALARLDGSPSSPDVPSYLHAVRAVAEADLGRFDEARRDLALIPDAEQLPPPLTSLSREAVARYVAARERR